MPKPIQATLIDFDEPNPNIVFAAQINRDPVPMRLSGTMSNLRKLKSQGYSTVTFAIGTFGQRVPYLINDVEARQ